MDHHCPWLNNCVGFYNHHYFYMFCLYTWLGTIFIMIFGVKVAYKQIWLKENIFKEYVVSFTSTYPNLFSSNFPNTLSSIIHFCILYEALTCVGVFAALGKTIIK